MAFYSVRQVAAMLGKDEETIRRWIRGGKLAATQASKKGGTVITSADLKDFVSRFPKYAPAVAASLALSPATLSIIIGGLLVGLASIIKSKGKLTEQDVEDFLERKIEAHEKAVLEKKQEIEKLQQEINENEKNIEKYKYALVNLDLKLLAEEINDEGK